MNDQFGSVTNSLFVFKRLRFWPWCLLISKEGSACESVCLCLTVGLSVCVLLWVCLCLTVDLPVCLSVSYCGSVCLSYCGSVCLSYCGSVCVLLCVCLVLLWVCLSVLSYCGSVCLCLTVGLSVCVLLWVCLSVLSYCGSVCLCQRHERSGAGPTDTLNLQLWMTLCVKIPYGSRGLYLPRTPVTPLSLVNTMMLKILEATKSLFV